MDIEASNLIDLVVEGQDPDEVAANVIKSIKEGSGSGPFAIGNAVKVNKQWSGQSIEGKPVSLSMGDSVTVVDPHQGEQGYDKMVLFNDGVTRAVVPLNVLGEAEETEADKEHNAIMDDLRTGCTDVLEKLIDEGNTPQANKDKINTIVNVIKGTRDPESLVMFYDMVCGEGVTTVSDLLALVEKGKVNIDTKYVEPQGEYKSKADAAQAIAASIGYKIHGKAKMKKLQKAGKK